ncbi:MAG: ice-binding family protein, partial [Byssovorax sp.]
NALAADHVWTFSTSDAPDTTLPTVSFTSPANQASAVPASAQVSAAFSEAMNPNTINAATFTLTQGAIPVPGTVTYAGLTATFAPTAPLATKATFTAKITNAVKDLSGNALAADYIWTFTTTDVIDVTPPLVTFTDPANGAKGVSVDTAVQVAFNEPMDCATLNAATFTLTNGGLPIPGLVTCTGPTATLTPQSPLSGNPTYTATVTTGARDLAGNALAMDHVWSFQTGQAAGESPVNLGAASSYAILAFNTVTNVNNPGTIVTGNLGISPGAALVGFPPGLVVGVVHAGDPIAAAAKASLLAAYNDAAGRLGAAVLAGDLSGLTFAPGLYKNSTSVMLSVGNLTLDAQGDANAVFIFQMGSTLTTNAGTQVILAGGAKATNIYWAVGTSATLGTNSAFKGTLLVASAITMKTGATIEGRLLAQGAAVALDTNAITVPGP